MTAADKYYLKAKDNYPYNLDDALEALEYGLSHDDGHPGLLTLKGRIYYDDLKQFEAARECFELALWNDNSFVEVYYAYIRLALGMEEYKKAEKLIANAHKVPGIDKARILYFEAQLLEKQNKYHNAIDTLNRARECCMNKESFSFYEEELERVRTKNDDLSKNGSQIKIVIKKG
jgi:tetratricopeptide (TPR) repeat protein